ncbi:nucleoside hydrolase [Glutamicibacter sp. MNS18]|uniref:uridine-preferring nucleoside hydrolase UriH n=1 Tax=Glutamicibacter sp. MNS18 TaxID=2989817 RepID=UPI0022365855|nr:nucleoside hydrolase [Glutamicibacter sp. MNS18]MCW4466666.1 nucleoside hydrolase [Glutamicibacter sp. MNS18]
MAEANPSSTPRKIILDCDPGHGDAVALLLAHGSERIELLAVTTVAGNQSLERVSANALAVGTVAGITGVPFAAGCARPLVRTMETADDIHGQSGMDGPAQPEPTITLDGRHAVDLLIETIMDHEPGEITLVPTGAMTNIALAVRKEPRIVPRVREVVLMGGGYHTGNWSAVAEFNIRIDPEAAHIVFNESWPVVMVGLDLTHQALATDEVVARIGAIGTLPARFVGELMEFLRTAYRQAQGFDAPPVHDPCAVAYVIDPSVVRTVKAPVDIELQGGLTLGMTVTDFRTPAAADCHTSVAVELDHRRFWDLVIQALENIGEVEPAETPSRACAR